MEVLEETTIYIAGITVNVSLVEVWELNSGPHTELVTIIRSTVEGEPKQYSTAQPFSDLEEWLEILDRYLTQVARFKRLETN